MLTPSIDSEGNSLQDQLESDLRDLFGCEIISDNASDDDTCSSCSSVYTIGDVSIISEISDSECEEFSAVEDEEGDVIEDMNDSDGPQELRSDITTSGCLGFVVCIDNVDMNVRRSDQRVGRTTQSYHFCQGYTALNRVDSTKLVDRPPSGVLSVDQILPSTADIDSILDDFTVLVERYVHISYCVVD